MQAFAPKVSGKVVKVCTDNKGVVAIVNKGSMVEDLLNMSLEIFQFCREHKIELKVHSVPRNMNVRAYEISRDTDFDD